VRGGCRIIIIDLNITTSKITIMAKSVRSEDVVNFYNNNIVRQQQAYLAEIPLHMLYSIFLARGLKYLNVRLDPR